MRAKASRRKRCRSQYLWHIQEQIEAQFELIKGVVSEVRSIRSVLGIAPSLIAPSQIKAKTEHDAKMLAEQAMLIERLARITLKIDTELTKPKTCASAVVEGHEIYILLEGLLDLEKEKTRLAKEIEKTAAYIKQIEAKLK
jgi:valyl-tRNA synthetase